MKLAQIEAFYCVIRAGSISKAARQLHLTQPALSLQIRDLEEFFNVQLLERTNKGVKPTAAGDLVYHYGQKLMRMRDTLCNEIEKLQTTADSQIFVGASTIVGGYALPCSIHTFKEKTPQVQIQLTVANSKRIMEMMMEGSLDIAFIEGPLEDSLGGNVAEELICKTLCYDELLAVSHPSLFPGERETISIEELSHLPMLVREKGSGVRASIEKALRDMGLSLSECNVKMELNSLDAIKATLNANQGFSILSYISVRKELYYGNLKALRIHGFSQKHPFIMLHPRRDFLAPLEKSFIEFMKSDDRGFC